LSRCSFIDLPTHNSSSHTLTISDSLSASAEGQGQLLVRISATSQTPQPAAQARHVICLVDTSGSMDETSPRGPADTEDSGFTRLDLARHALVVLAHSLGPSDTLCIISFSSQSNVVFEEAMHEHALSRALEAISKMKAGGGTNMWQGLQLAMQRATAHRSNAHILLLTDGCATDEPQGGLSAAFAGLYSSCAGPVGLHTLGFGYGINSALLAALADTTRGVFAFVPDASMIGTVFVNILSSVQATAHVRAQLVFSGLESSPTRVIDIGALQHSQSRTMTLQVPDGEQSQVTLQACTWDGPVPLATATAGEARGQAGAGNRDQGLLAQARDATIRTIGEAVQQGSVCNTAMMRQLHDRLLAMADSVDDADTREAVCALAADAWAVEADRGQLGHAVASASEATRWGLHYLRSQQRAHQLQVCLNFRDAGLQAYSSPLFAAMQARVECLFCTLPAPAPTGDVAAHRDGASSHHAAPSTMASYYTTSCG